MIGGHQEPFQSIWLIHKELITLKMPVSNVSALKYAHSFHTLPVIPIIECSPFVV